METWVGLGEREYGGASETSVSNGHVHYHDFGTMWPVWFYNTNGGAITAPPYARIQLSIEW